MQGGTAPFLSPWPSKLLMFEDHMQSDQQYVPPFISRIACGQAKNRFVEFIRFSIFTHMCAGVAIWFIPNLQFFHDFGWKCVTDMAAMIFFKHPFIEGLRIITSAFRPFPRNAGGSTSEFTLLKPVIHTSRARQSAMPIIPLWCPAACAFCKAPRVTSDSLPLRKWNCETKIATCTFGKIIWHPRACCMTWWILQVSCL